MKRFRIKRALAQEKSLGKRVKELRASLDQSEAGKPRGLKAIQAIKFYFLARQFEGKPNAMIPTVVRVARFARARRRKKVRP
jgi:hypothetical protein